MDYKFRSNIKSILLFAAGCLLFVAMTGPVSAQIIKLNPKPAFKGYTLTDLGVNAGWSFAYAINNAGQAVGDMTKSNGELRAFRTQPNQLINQSSDDLGVLLNNYRSYGQAISSGGVVAGDSVRNSPYIQKRAIRYGSNGALMEDLHMPTGAIDTFARGINDFGWIAGSYTTTNNKSHAVVFFDPGSYQIIDYWLGFPAESASLDVNNRNQIVGWRSPTPYTPPRAFLFDVAAGLRVIDIGMLQGGATSTAYSVNELGHVVGQSQKAVGTQAWTHAFFFHDANNNGIADAGEMRDLDTMGNYVSGAMSINNGGTAVGYYGDPTIIYGGSRAAIFLPTGTMADLHTMIPAGTAGWTLRVANSINDYGQIVGWMEDDNIDQRNRIRHAFRLDPIPQFLPFP